MASSNWRNNFQSVKVASPLPGTYRLRLPVPGSDRKTAAEQIAMLPADETFAPVVLVAVALVCIRLHYGTDPLSGGRVCCAEQSVAYGHVELEWSGTYLSVCYNHGGYGRGIWASSVRVS